MSEPAGIFGIVGEVQCDLCGDTCDPTTADLNALDCTFAGCHADASVYHQECLEKYLRSIRCEK